MSETTTDGIRSPHIYALLMERYGWTAGQIDEMADATLQWLLSLIATERE